MPPRRAQRARQETQEDRGQRQQSPQLPPEQPEQRAVSVIARKRDCLVSFPAKAQQPVFGSSICTGTVTDGEGREYPFQCSAADTFVLGEAFIDYTAARALCEAAAHTGVFPPACPTIGADYTIVGLKLLGLVVRLSFCLFTVSKA